MKQRRSFISLLLAFCLLLQPFIPVFAANDNSESVQQAQEEFQKSYDTIMALEEVDLEGFGSACVGAVSGVENIGTWFGNAWDKLTNDGKNQKEYVDYLKDIEDANAKIRQAKADAQQMKAAFDAGNISGAKDADPSKVVNGGIAAQAKAMATLRDTLTKAGNALVKVGELCSTISTVLTIASVVMEGVSLCFPPAAPFLAGPIAFCNPAATALGIAGPLIESAGKSLLESAEAGYTSDAQLLGNMAVDVGTEGVKQAVIYGVSKGAEKMLGDTAEVLAKKYGANSDEILGTMTAAWNPKNAVKTGFAQTFKNEFSHLQGEAADKFFENAADVAVDVASDLTGAEIPSIEGAIENGVEEALDAGKEYIKEKTVRKSKKRSKGLSVEME